MKKLFFLLLFPITASAQFSNDEIAAWKQRAAQITIVRDSFGIPHVYGNTDADAVFGLMYAQCEDDFPRVELNYLEKLGRLAEIYGEDKIYDDLLIQLLIDTSAAKADYHNGPEWLRKLCNAWADGINYFLYTHPEVHPQLLNSFQPWHPMLWTDGSIGAILTAGFDDRDLEQFYEHKKNVAHEKESKQEAPLGSNGFAFAPGITASGNAILYINPHVTFYFRPEVHVVSKEGLNAYGAITWGQFFVYQGFNEHCGWMHTSTYADVSDAYIEEISKEQGKLVYTYDGKQYPVIQKPIKIRYKVGNEIKEKNFTGYYTGHGPVLGIRNGKWISVKSNNRDIKGLIQSWRRTKAESFAEYKEVMDLLANASNNTVYADAEGNIAYWHGNFIPRRDPKYDWSRPVDGTTSASDWKGLHPVNEAVHIYNPPNGWIENCNSTPFTAAGKYSPKREDYPEYMAPDGQNFRALNAIRILPKEKKYTLEKVIEIGYNTYLTAFEVLIPALVKVYARPDVNDAIKKKLHKPVTMLKQWNKHCAENSIATTLAIYWGENLRPAIYRTDLPPGTRNDFVNKTTSFAETASPEQLLQPLLAAMKELKEKFDTWETEWGQINRFQRISGDIRPHFDDDLPSYPVGYTASVWGTLPAYGSRSFDNTRKRYGRHGNSFICAVEFGERVKAKALLAGGESGHENSPHFFDQGYMYSKGIFRDVWYYKEDVMQHAEKVYHPGE